MNKRLYPIVIVQLLIAVLFGWSAVSLFAVARSPESGLAAGLIGIIALIMIVMTLAALYAAQRLAEHNARARQDCVSSAWLAVLIVLFLPVGTGIKAMFVLLALVYAVFSTRLLYFDKEIAVLFR